MAFRKIEAGLVHAPVDEFIGKTGTIFYDNDLGDFRISDGATPGGIALSFGSGNGGNYTLPTATTTVKGGVKIDGTTIAIANQVISVGTVPYSKLSGTPTIPTNNNQLTNGAAYITSSALTGLATESYVTGRGYITSSALSGYATENYVTSQGYITSSALSGYATESYVTGRGYITSSALSGYALTTAIPTNNNQLSNGSGYITSAALTGLATESYVTSRGYISSVSWNDIQNKPNLAGTYSFGIAGDDSTIVEIASGNTVQFKGATNITVATSADGVVTITGPDLSSYALTTAIPTDISDLTDNSGLLGQGGGGTTYITNTVENPYSFSIAGDDSTLREIANGESIKFTGAGGITITTDAEGNVTVTGTPVSLTGYATESYVTSQGYITSSALTGLATESYVTSRGYITGLSWDQLTDKPDIAATYSWSIAGDDSTLREITTGDSVKFSGAGGITTTSDANGNITITAAPGIIVSATAPTDPLAKQWYNSVDGRTYVKYNDLWVDANPPVVPEVSTYLDGLVVEGTTITTVSYTDTDIKIHDLTFTANGVIQLPEGGDIVDSTGASVLGGTSGPSDRLVAGDNSVILGTDGSLTIPGDLINPDGFILNAGGHGSLAIGKFIEVPGVAEHFHIAFPDSNIEVPYQDLYLGNDFNYFKIRGSHNEQTMGVDIGAEGQRWEFNPNGVITLPNGSTIGDGDAVFGVPITTTRGTIFLGNQAECLGGENHFHIMKAGQQAIDLFLGDDNNYVKLPNTGGVEISSSEIGDQYYWTFGTDGNLTLPNGMTIDSYGTSGVNAFVNIGGDNTRISIDNDGAPPGFSVTTNAAVTARTWRFGPDGELSFPDATVQTTAWLGTYSWNDLTDKPNLAGTYTWSIAADDSSQLEIGTGNLVKIQGAGGITTALDADGNITVTGAPGIITSATAPTDALAKQWYNSTDGRTYVKYNDLWVDANPPVVPEVSTYLDGLVVEGTTVSATEYNASITVQDVEFTADGRIQLPEGGDIVDSLGNSVLVDASAIPTNNNQLANGAGYITTAVNANGTFSLPILTAEPANLQAGQIALANGTSWDPLAKNDGKPYMAIYTGSAWIDIGGLTRTDVYTQILELG